MSSSHLGSRLRRSASFASVAPSDTTYHSFQEMELCEPVRPYRTDSGNTASTCTYTYTYNYTHSDKNSKSAPRPITRHDSGYASIPAGSTTSGSSSKSARRSSTTSGGGSGSSTPAAARPRTRPSIRRAARSTPGSRAGASPRQSLHIAPGQQQRPDVYYHFPSLEGSLDSDAAPRGEGEHGDSCGGGGGNVDDEHLYSYPPPPPTTHYWTTDHTRRLEYAAIDNASRGFKGWLLRHLVPDCFIPQDTRRVGFDDDSGSVRRYRLELECDDTAQHEKSGGGGGGITSRKLGWLTRR